MLSDGREIDVGSVEGDPLQLRAKALRRILQRMLGPVTFARYGQPTLCRCSAWPTQLAF